MSFYNFMKCFIQTFSACAILSFLSAILPIIVSAIIWLFPLELLPPCIHRRAGGPRVVVSTAAFHARVRGSVPGLGGFKETKMILPHTRVKVSIVGSLCDREVACSASDRQGSNFESCVWRTMSSQSSHHPQKVLLAQFSLYVHKGGLKPDLFHFHFAFTSTHTIVTHSPINCQIIQLEFTPTDFTKWRSTLFKYIANSCHILSLTCLKGSTWCGNKNEKTPNIFGTGGQRVKRNDTHSLVLHLLSNAWWRFVHIVVILANV